MLTLILIADMVTLILIADMLTLIADMLTLIADTLTLILIANTDTDSRHTDTAPVYLNVTICWQQKQSAVTYPTVMSSILMGGSVTVRHT